MTGTAAVQEPPEARVNGVFKGGGAKGLLYAGALRALAERGLWFRAVSGASAGAITATLIAAGLTLEQLEGAVPNALAGVRKMPLGDLVGSPLFRVGGLETWLRTTLREQLDAAGVECGPEQEPTFAMLYEATGIELYVVAVDVALRQPIVFGSLTTPDLPVVPAVVASSAIPLAFRPGRLCRTRADGTVDVHRLMDGGVWANYPMFVFKDASFREHHDLPPVPAGSLTIGFTLDSGVAADAAVPTGFASSTTPRWKDLGAGLRGWLRIAPLRLYLMTIAPLIIVFQTFYSVDHGGLTAFKDYATREGVPGIVTTLMAWVDGFFTHFSPGLWIVLGVMCLVAIGMALLGATLLDSGGPALKTLMAVGTDVPYWVGTTTNDHVVRLRVPPGLSTTSFKVEAADATKAVQGAYEQAAPQLDGILKAVA